MPEDIIPPLPEGSRLAEWADDGVRRAPSHSNIVVIISPEEEYALTVEVDDPIHGYLIRLYRQVSEEHNDVVAQTVVDDRELALEVAAQMAAAAENLAALGDDPDRGPPTIYEEDIGRGSIEAPEESGWDDDEWAEQLEEAYEEAGLPRSKGTLVTKQIDGREYYYLQWREGDTVTSQYVAPVTPA